MITNSSSGDLTLIKREKTFPCISILVPTHKKAHERRADPALVKKAVERAGRMLTGKYGTAGTGKLLDKINELYQSIDFIHNGEGIGLFASPTVSRIVHFPFPVKEKVMVGENFEIRDVVYKHQQVQPFWVLSLSEKEVRLFRGEEETLEEIKDQHFPKIYTETYEYERPSHASSNYSSLKNTEKDKSILKSIRVENFFRSVNESLNLYPQGFLVLSGAQKNVTLFEKIASQKERIAGKTGATFEKNPAFSLAKPAYEIIRKCLRYESKRVVKELQEMKNRSRVVGGLQNVWKSVQEGKGMTLVVEKDFSKPGFIANDPYRLLLRPVKNSDSKILPDAVDDIIEETINKKGRVVFAENGELEHYDRIALITRY